ncbi:hypothetical protein [Portibacter marinus]|uniref:hypothetical protein n=1 Tax=Portibacter marinus TaxID=2898660 RepID=UPI001F303C93|nr:hypothetical protein [Portibacter marinus]
MKNLLLLFLTFFIYSCEKNILDDSNEPYFELSEEVRNGIQFVDGIAQIDYIKDVELSSVNIENGIMKFDSSSHLIKTIQEFDNYNSESIISFFESKNFPSLFSLYTRYNEMPPDDMPKNLNIGNSLLRKNEHRIEFSGISKSLSRVLNRDGMLQVGEFIGRYLEDKVIWVPQDKFEDLLSYKKGDEIDSKDFIIIENDVQQVHSRDLLESESCPLHAPYTSSLELENSSGNRKINVVFSFERIITPCPGNYFDLDFLFSIDTESRKKSFWTWFLYTTDMYVSMNLFAEKYINQQPTGTGWNHNHYTTYGLGSSFTYSALFPVGKCVPQNYWVYHYAALDFVIPGTSHAGSTASSHRGMGGDYIRLECN